MNRKETTGSTGAGGRAAKAASGPAIDSLVRDAIFPADKPFRDRARQAIREQAAGRGAVPASIQTLYEAAGKGLYRGVTVPAINLRGLAYDSARAVFRAAMKHRVGPFIFEIARSEIGYTGQRPAEYSACVLAAAVREGFSGPVFIQGDHFQVSRSRYGKEPEQELAALRDLIKEAIEAGFYNIDIDSSTLVDLEQAGLEKQQERNCRITAELTRFIRSLEPAGMTISVGGEIGEVGERNSTTGDLRAFMAGYRRHLGGKDKGVSKISVQTGTTHGGIVLPDGSIAEVELDFKTLEELSRMARQEYGMAGAVQHGASTLPDRAFDMFPKAGAAEVHLATGFQNIIYESQHFPVSLLDTIHQYLVDHHSDEKKAGETEEQFFYKTRKRGFGPFKSQMWDLPAADRDAIGAELEERFSLLFQKLNVYNTVELVSKYVQAPASAR